MKIPHAMMLVSAALALVMPLTIVACPNPKPPSDPTDADAAQGTDADPGPSDDASDEGRPTSCSSACSHLRSMRCPLADPTPKGATCEQVCSNVQKNGGGVGFDTRCLAKVRRCDETLSCR